MDYSKPTLIVISGPNGAGKSTHIQSLLPAELAHIPAYNRDVTFRKFKDDLLANHADPLTIDHEALQLMEHDLLGNMIKAINSGAHFVLETPLSAGRYWAYLDRFENAGYQIQLLYLCLDSVTDCLNRVFQRSQQGGMDVDQFTVKEIYRMNLQYINEYRKTFKSLSLIDGMQTPKLLVTSEDNALVYADREALKKNWVKLGFPEIAGKVSRHLKSDTAKQKTAVPNRSKRL
jgi:predicted ABC-type ATPase